MAKASWVTAYYAGWAKWNAVPVDISDLDFTCGTHWIFFTLAPQSNGTFDGTGSGIDATRHQQFVTAAHAAGAKALIGTGGWGSDYTGIVTNISTSVAQIVNLMNTYGYDGLDVDWEPVPAAQYTNYSNWIKALKAAKPNMILTAACFNFDQAVVNNQQYFDQINLMTYDMSGAWNPVSWHNSPLYAPTGGNLGSVDASLNGYISAGVPAAKLGFGIELYAYVWNGVTGPQQSPYGTIQNTVPYWTVMQNYYDAGAVLNFDTVGQAYYYSTPSQFISMDYEDTMMVKANYVQSKGVGGVIIYEAGVGRVPGQTPTPDRIMQQIKHAFLEGPSVPPLPYVAPPPPPVKKSYPVFTDSLQSPWWNGSWVQGGMNEAATDPNNATNKVIQVGYYAWDGLRYYTGPWGNQPLVASDELSFDMYPQGAAFAVTIMIEGGIAQVLSAPRDTWTRLKVKCPPTAFSWFYLQNNTSAQHTVFFDNIAFNTSGSAPLPPPTGSNSGSNSGSYTEGYNAGYTVGYAAGVASVDTQAFYNSGFTAGVYSVNTQSYYNSGFTAGVASVNTQSYYDSGFTAGVASVNTQAYYNSGYAAGFTAGKAAQWDKVTYTYIYNVKFSSGSVPLPSGSIVTATSYNNSSKVLAISYLQPKI